MKRKIITALLILLLLSAFGAALATYFINTTTTTLNELINMHQVEDLRKHLVIYTQNVQSDLYTVNTALANNLDDIVDNVIRLEAATGECTDCHHKPAVARDLQEIEDLILTYQEALSSYITTAANKQRINALKMDAAAIGSDILKKIEDMSFQAAKKIKIATGRTLKEIEQVRFILFSTIGITFIFSVLVAIHLILSVTRPIQQLVTATRAIARGDLGHNITADDKTEFGELADHFNVMSTTLKENYEALIMEVSERKQAEAALRESQERYALASRGANDGLWDLDLRNATAYYSCRWKSMLGYKEDEIGTSLEEWFGRVHDMDRAMVEAKLAAHIDRKTQHFECEYRIHHKNNSIIWVRARGLAVRDNEGKAYRLAGSQTDITARKKAEDQMIHDAFHDQLTGLANRALFLNRLKHVVESSNRNDSQFYAVLFTDLDRFKVINDSLGHDIGDKLLVEVGRRLKICLRPGDTVARLGGDEFAILLENIATKIDIEDIVRRIEEETAAPFNIQGHKLFTSQSIGIAYKSERYQEPEEILRDADIAMYQAKDNGGAQHAFFDSIMHATIVARNQLEGELRRAVDHREGFILHYQPIMKLKDRSLSGFEALIRWEHRTKGILSPNDFISIAEETGLIIPISKWLIGQACRQLRIWHDMYPTSTPLKMSVNISSKTLLLDDFVDNVVACLHKEDIQAEYFAIEITENVILEHNNIAQDNLMALQDMGVNIHVDDFGTGYSSLSYLHKFPFNTLKIDRSFISKIPEKKDELEIVKTIIALANNLKLNVIAEGLEQEHQVSILHDLDCDYGQGFFFSKALAPDAIPSWIKSNNIKM